jgi:di/tricarboxylate transporter
VTEPFRQHDRPGGDAFGGDWKLGLPLLIRLFVVSVFLVPLIWRF